MRLARFRNQGRARLGIVETGEVVEVRGSMFRPFVTTDIRHPLTQVILLPPVMPRQSWCPGLNFANHLAEAYKVTGQTSMRDTPEPWQKGVGSAVIGSGASIRVPYDSASGIEYEGECVAVIGKQARRVTPVEGWDYILGYMCGNDVTERTWQKEDGTWWRSKGTDTFSPIGPWIETELDPREGCDMVVRLNGREVQRANTRDMHFEFGTLVSYISQWVTLHPGDLIWSGTSGEPGAMRPGDTVEVEVEGIGVLKNTISIEQQAASQ